MKHWLTIGVLLAVAMAGCARQGYPTGGAKDTRPPTPLATRPANESRQFGARQFYIEFDEYVVLKNADQNVLVSPPMAKKPEFTTRGKGILVKWTDTLRPSTTYLFQFKEAIADFTEGNLLPSFEYVFSTGTQMDTLMLAGRALRARDGKPWPGVLSVSAIRRGDTLPTYVTRTDKQGHFAFHYIPRGEYRLVVSDDKNRNWLPDGAEAAGWDTTHYAAVDSVDSLHIPLLRVSSPERKTQRVVRSEYTARGRINIVTAQPMSQPTLEGAPLEWRLNDHRDTLAVWLHDVNQDSVRLVFRTDSICDTLRLRYRAPQRKNRLAASIAKKDEPLVRPLCDGKRAFYDDLQLSFLNPIVAVREDAMAEVMSMKDSSVAQYPIRLDSSGMKARIEAVLRSDETYRCHLDDSLFTDLYGRRSDSLSFTLTPKDYATLTVFITNPGGEPVVAELLDSRDTVVVSRPVPPDGRLRLSHIAAGEYRLRAVIDSDSNGRWTPGDYATGRQPEPFVLFDKTLALREKWEIEERWILAR